MSSMRFTQATRRELNSRQAETVERVTAAAQEELREVGWDGLTVRSVANRAGVAPATAYTYFSSKNHLVAELFWRRLHERPRLEETLSSPLGRVVGVFDDLADFLAGEPALAAATTSALLGTEPDVRQLRLMIGNEVTERIVHALGDAATPEIVEALTIGWSGAMLQAGMGHAEYAEMGERLARFAKLVMGDQR
jgi:TetR/AcrR family transcriptional regulator, cholesterol catabolism regulator